MASFIEKMAQHCFSTLIMDGPELLYSQTKCLCFSKIEIEKGWFLWNKRGIQYLERWQDSGEQGGWWPTFLKILLFNQSFLRLSNVVRTDDSQWSWIIYKIAVDFMTYSKTEEFKMFNDIIWGPWKIWISKVQTFWEAHKFWKNLMVLKFT